MGNFNSKPPTPPPPPPPLFDKPWLEMNWSKKEADLQFVMNYRPQAEGQELRILLHGSVGAGKSSFINSVNSIFQNRVCVNAFANNQSCGSFTFQYKTYRMQRENEPSFYPFVFNDMAGMEFPNQECRTVHVKDVTKIMKGHVNEEYKFHKNHDLSERDQYFNKTPSEKDKVNVLVCVVDGNRADLLADQAMETIKEIRKETNSLEIPQVAIMTKIDEAAPEIKKDLKNVYRSKVMHERIKLFSQHSGIPENCIFPVKNYHQERELNNDIDTLILSTLRRIIEIGDDSLNNHYRRELSLSSQ